MTLNVALTHVTRYDFDKPVHLSPHIIRLKPAPHCRTDIHAYSLKITGGDHFINWQQDPFGNYLARLVFPKKMQFLQVAVEVIAPMSVINPFDFFVEESASDYPFQYSDSLKKELLPYLQINESGPLLTEWLADCSVTPQTINDFLVYINRRVEQDIAYSIRMEPGVQSAEETLQKKVGSCRDSAWLLVQIMRHLGIAARFVSGYLIQLTPDVKALDGPSGTTEDFTDLHAWAEVYIPGAGWIGLDPTSGLLAGEGHLPLAATPEPSSAAPISGATDPCEVTFDFHMSVARVHEDPRVTKPYTEEQWQSINQLGLQVDEEIRARDLRLTQGGEPTFVSIDSMDAPEWTTEAQGPTKRKMAETLMKRLRPHFAPQSLRHFQQGKWYPGEPLPRWALACYWRKDGIPLWQEDRWLADIEQDYGMTVEHAQLFMQLLAQQLQVAENCIYPGYEDTYYYLWIEQKQPVDIDLSQHDLGDESERRRLARLLEKGLDKITGFALPLAKGEGKTWLSGRWPVRRSSLYLIPGDSPMGLRLPLDELPLAGRMDLPHTASLFESKPPLADIHGEVAVQYMQWTDYHSSVDTRQRQQLQRLPDQNVSPFIITTALCIEPREGKLFVFMPPLAHLEEYIELLAHVEYTAKSLNMPVCIEGYPPPADNRIEKFLITPDPGVIEVNIMPAHDWPSLVRHTEILYEEARLSRLGAEKYMLDGRHTGTGGGNHVTLGGATPADSPFLRQPQLLTSMITFWQHHPSLSYLFSGMFLGPTSQAPRIDEARHEALYELEIAMQQMPAGEIDQPWLVDRLLRHLLTDITGNTHRAEFCIDKLYSPDSPTGRLGLVELRGFEMPPHPRMSIIQHLLIRALVVRFSQESYQHKLVPWGTALHDRWMLPHYLWADFLDVLDDLRQHGFDFKPEWFAAFLEFRFPHYGEVVYNDVKLELRQAIEPWHVLGEEVSGSGTARYVDSSVERVQVKVFGYNPLRHKVTCNGREVPLQPTGVNSEAVAGVRYRAWQPPSALHPKIPVHAPLVFDLIDTWNQRSLGGFTYHVSHPGGRSHDAFPVNANEAEARRLARFWSYGHTQGPIECSAEHESGSYPHTLDLRTSG